MSGPRKENYGGEAISTGACYARRRRRRGITVGIRAWKSVVRERNWGESLQEREEMGKVSQYHLLVQVITMEIKSISNCNILVRI